jgi:hypothetical protein
MKPDAALTRCRQVLSPLPTEVLNALVTAAIDELDARAGDPDLEIEEAEDDAA